MKLFSKKKEEKKELPPLKFPEFPKEQKIPKYEPGISSSEAASLKQAVSPQNLEIPIRKPMGGRSFAPETRPSFEEPYKKDIQKRGQTLFVKIERYKDATSKMEIIKERILEAEKILKKLDEMKHKEDEEFAKWHEDLETIKQKILSVDKSLFGG